MTKKNEITAPENADANVNLNTLLCHLAPTPNKTYAFEIDFESKCIKLYTHVVDGKNTIHQNGGRVTAIETWPVAGTVYMDCLGNIGETK